jgi:hypothetical protein
MKRKTVADIDVELRGVFGLSHIARSDRSNRRSYSRPGFTMQRNIPGAIGAKLDQMKTGFCNASLESAAKRGGV